MVMLLEGRHLQFFVDKKLDPSSYYYYHSIFSMRIEASVQVLENCVKKQKWRWFDLLTTWNNSIYSVVNTSKNASFELHILLLVFSSIYMSTNDIIFNHRNAIQVFRFYNAIIHNDTGCASVSAVVAPGHNSWWWCTCWSIRFNVTASHPGYNCNTTLASVPFHNVLFQLTLRGITLF